MRTGTRVRAWISGGSNEGDRCGHLESALRELRDSGSPPVRVSAIYETEPVGLAEQPWFLNLVAEVETSWSPEQLLHECQAIESYHGRRRTVRWGPRTLDLDVLLYGRRAEKVIRTHGLEIPHPRLAERKFVLAPLAELAPDLVHPISMQTVASLLAACPDTSTVRLYSPGGSPR
jgi:2-amino-4-hydroxy-6-hydroxymethyldihydropteridine diphosphokinase